MLMFDGRSSRPWTLGLVLMVAYVAQHHAQADLVESRHNVPPPNKDANIEYPTSQNSALMLSPCRPEKDGYIGATNGVPSVLQYAFELESETNADISSALATIREHVMDVTVATTFPAVCSFRDLSTTQALPLDTKGVTGLKFGQDYDAIQSCPGKDGRDDTYCGIFTGTLAVYGSNLSDSLLQSLLQALLQDIPSAAAKLVPYGVSRLDGSPEFSKKIAAPTPETILHRRRSLLTRGAIVGIIIFSLVIMVSIFAMARMVWNENDIRANEMSDSQQDGVLKLPTNGRWILTRRCPLNQIGDDCEATQVSIMSMNSSSKNSCNRSYASSRTKSHQRIPIRKAVAHRSAQGTSHSRVNTSSVSYDVEPDSIYIVEPEDDEIDDEIDGIFNELCGEYGVDPLSQRRDLEML